MSPRHHIATAALLSLVASGSQAQGIPVIDAANLVQTIQHAIDDINMIRNQIQQIQQLQEQIKSMTGSRLLGTVADNPMLRNYVPPNAYAVVNAISTSGYGGLNATGKSLRDAGMVYNCMDLNGPARTSCQATLAQPYQYKGMLQDAMHAASGRLAQIQALMGQINATTDQKSVQEIQARIGAENALLAHESSQVQMLADMAESEDRVARARDRERQYEGLYRTGKAASHMH